MPLALGPGQQKHRRIEQTNFIHVNLGNQLNLPSCANHSIHVTQPTQARKQILTNNSITATSQVWQQKIIRASLAIFS